MVGLILFSVSAISVSGTTTDITYDAAHGDALAAVDAHSTQFEREYPDNYVLSRWGHNRMFNYHVNGESERYSYARKQL